MPTIKIEAVEYRDVAVWRELYRAEAQCQIVSDSLLQRGLADAYLLIVDGKAVGYAGVRNKYDPDRIQECYLHPHRRDIAQEMFRELIVASGAKEIQAQSNMPFMRGLLFDFGENINAESVLFADHHATDLACPGSLFRPARREDATDDAYVLEIKGQVVGGGGFFTHYNPPYGDVYMQVVEDERRKGYGAYIVQEVKRLCYEAGKVPGARCNVSNGASRKTLIRAGFLPVGHLLVAEITADFRRLA